MGWEKRRTGPWRAWIPSVRRSFGSCGSCGSCLLSLGSLFGSLRLCRLSVGSLSALSSVSRVLMTKLNKYADVCKYFNMKMFVINNIFYRRGLPVLGVSKCRHSGFECFRPLRCIPCVLFRASGAAARKRGLRRGRTAVPGGFAGRLRCRVVVLPGGCSGRRFYWSGRGGAGRLSRG